MKTKISRYAWGPTLFLLTILFACSSPPPAPEGRESARLPEEAKAAPGEISAYADSASGSSQLPVRFQTPAYSVVGNKEIGDLLGTEEEFTVKVGADISSTSGPVVLRDIIKKLAALKNMNVSWASDVDQYSYVDVDIRADDDFFKSIDNLLRQRDYFHEVQGNTVVVKFRETRQFHVAMPFISSNYDSSVGTDISDNSKSTIANKGKGFDVWDNITKNLDTVLQIWETTKVKQEPEQSPASTAPARTPAAGEVGVKTAEPVKTAVEMSRSQSAKGYYTIDKPIGLITVTAPRVIMEKVESYLNNLKTELYKQVSIEAKFLQVTVNDNSALGINWQNLLSSVANTASIGASINTSTANIITGNGIRSFTLTVPDFNLIVQALENQGATKVLANPRISVLNGQPALLNVGTQTTYVKKVTQTISDSGIPSISVETAIQGAGVMMSVVPTIMDNDEIILNLIPVNSSSDFSNTVDMIGVQASLPVTQVQELSTIVRIKQGETLVVGGLIYSSDADGDQYVPLLGKLPLIGRLFGVKSKNNTKNELVILLKPVIIS